MRRFTIGQLAKQAGIHVATLRYYERRGLLPRPPRTVANYRVYDQDNLLRVQFIKQAQGLGLSLKEIGQLLALRATPRARCEDVKRYANQKISEIDVKIRSLKRMQHTLARLVDECSGEGPVTSCPILASLEVTKPPRMPDSNSKR